MFYRHIYFSKNQNVTIFEIHTVMKKNTDIENRMKTCLLPGK